MLYFSIDSLRKPFDRLVTAADGVYSVNPISALWPHSGTCECLGDRAAQSRPSGASILYQRSAP